MKKINVTLMFFFVSIFFPLFTHSAVNLPWSTNFNYGPCSRCGSDLSYPTNCVDVQDDGINWCHHSPGTCLNGKCTGVTENGRVSGNAARFWKGSGARNIQSTPVMIAFPTPQKELWIRWYERYETGFTWNNFGGHKSIYMAGAGGTSGAGSLYGGFESNSQLLGMRIVNQGGSGDIPRTSNYGWKTVYPTGTSDGTWFCHEWHLKMDTGGANGIARMWLNGVLVVSETTVNWSSNNATALNGWTVLYILSNQEDPGLDRDYYVDVDDMAIYNTTPPNVDEHGNPFIGPIGWETPEAPQGLRIITQ